MDENEFTWIYRTDKYGFVELANEKEPFIIRLFDKVKDWIYQRLL